MDKPTKNKLSKAQWVLFQSTVMEEAFQTIQDANYEPKLWGYFELILAVLSEARIALPIILRGDVIGDHSDEIQRNRNILAILDLHREAFESALSGYEWVQNGGCKSTQEGASQ